MARRPQHSQVTGSLFGAAPAPEAPTPPLDSPAARRSYSVEDVLTMPHLSTPVPGTYRISRDGALITMLRDLTELARDAWVADGYTVDMIAQG